MQQKIPTVSDADIKRIVRRDFSEVEFAEIENILGVYKSESNKGKNRIYASILKLSEGKIDLLKMYVDKANDDYRDIIALSEYPRYSEHAFEDDLPEKLKKHLIDDDWIQYQTWFKRL